MITRNQVSELVDSTVYDTEGDKVGKVSQVYLDRSNDQPSWVTVRTGWFGMRESFVPLRQARTTEDGLQIAVDKETVKEAPQIDTDSELSPQREYELYDYYQLTADGDPNARHTADGHAQYEEEHSRDDAMTRSEERLRVGTEETEQGRARLRKYVVTENVSQTVPVRHEEVRVEREPITPENRRAAMSGPEISEAEHEVTLHAERPVVETETVPVERVRLRKNTVTEQEQVGGKVRKEKIDFEPEGIEPTNHQQP